jgi:UDP-N-acetyl-D-mannosaminuronic acid dehydrogenase
MKESLINKINCRRAKITVFGLGHIGLPIATSLASLGFQVTGVDSSLQVLDTIRKGEAHTSELNLNSIISRSIVVGSFKVTLAAIDAVKESDIIIICVPTPIRKDKTPDLSYIENVCKTIASGLSEGKLVVFESTLPPRTTKDLVVPLLENAKGLKCGVNFWLAYCPERLTPGNAMEDFIKNDKIVGGFDAESTKIASKFFGNFIRGNVLKTDMATAEIVKLSENTFRDINIAFANELALICEQHKVDVLEVIKLANTHPRVNIHMPGPGVGGPCLPKDPHLLLYSFDPKNYDIIKAARQINDYMPSHIVTTVYRAIEGLHKEIKTSRIAVLGTAYKANVDHATFSPSESVIRKLANLGASITVYDPLCDESFGARKVQSINEAIEKADCIIILTDHSEFKNLELQKVKSLMSEMPIIVDGKRIIDSRQAVNLGFIYYGVGFHMVLMANSLKSK